MSSRLSVSPPPPSLSDNVHTLTVTATELKVLYDLFENVAIYEDWGLVECVFEDDEGELAAIHSLKQKIGEHPGRL